MRWPGLKIPLEICFRRGITSEMSLLNDDGISSPLSCLFTVRVRFRPRNKRGFNYRRPQEFLNKFLFSLVQLDYFEKEFHSQTPKLKMHS